MLDADASSAKTLTLVAIIIQAVFFVIGLFSILALAAFLVSTSSVGPGGTTTVSTGLGGLGVLTLIFTLSFGISILWILLDYFLIYKRLAEERVREAETPAIVLGIIQLLFGGLIPGILLIIAYVKIRDSGRRYAQYPYQQYPPPPQAPQQGYPPQYPPQNPPQNPPQQPPSY